MNRCQCKTLASQLVAFPTTPQCQTPIQHYCGVKLLLPKVLVKFPLWKIYALISNSFVPKCLFHPMIPELLGLPLNHRAHYMHMWRYIPLIPMVWSPRPSRSILHCCPAFCSKKLAGTGGFQWDWPVEHMTGDQSREGNVQVLRPDTALQGLQGCSLDMRCTLTKTTPTAPTLLHFLFSFSF